MSRTPEPNDRVYDYRRLAANKRPDGFVYDVDEDEGWYTVTFPSGIIREGNCVRINGILQPDIILVMLPELLYEGDDEETYWFGEILWSSSDGGTEQWVRS